MLTQTRLKEILEYDPETGDFTWLIASGSRGVIGIVAGTDHGNGYKKIRIDRERYYSHRLAWLYIYGSWPREFIDHIDGDSANNRLINLRGATNSQNVFNSAISSNNTSGVKGVWVNKTNGKFVANVWRLGKKYSGGHHDTIEDATSAVKRLREKLHGEFARVG